VSSDEVVSKDETTNLDKKISSDFISSNDSGENTAENVVSKIYHV
jgi:hypothetical protein